MSWPSLCRTLRSCSRHLASPGAHSSQVLPLSSAFARLSPAAALVRDPGSFPTIRLFGSSPRLSGSSEDLKKAQEKLSVLTEDPGNEIKLRLYGLFKQATVGVCNIDKPGMMDFVKKAKWDAWNSLGSLSQSDAIDQYCQVVDELVGSAQEGQSAADTPIASDCEEIKIEKEGGLLTITLNRPDKFNALNYKMYAGIQKALIDAGEDSSVVVAMITGAGDYYCSGNDLSNFLNIPPEGPEKLAADAKEILREFVSSFINFPKPLIAAVNGPAIGVSVTVLGLCDLVYAADNATFHTPFMSLGQSPEGCSSYVFPQIMGGAKANEVLLGGKKLNAQEACERNLVTQVLPAGQFREQVKEIATRISKLPPQSLCKSKELLRNVDREKLEETNIIECELLAERWLSEECMKAIVEFMERKK